jgi:transposase
MKAAKKVKTIQKTAVREAVAAVGIDLGDRWSHWCSLSSTGEVIDRGRVKTSAEALSELSAGWAGIPVAIENGTHSGWISRTLKKAGCTVWVANPSRWRGTAHSSKNDANDAEALARVVRLDPKLLYPITHRTQQQQEDLSVIRVRAQLVKARTLLVNTARGAVKSVGARLPATDADAFHNTSWKHCGKHCARSTSRSPRSPSRSALWIARLRSSLKRGIKRQLCSAAFLVLDPSRPGRMF